MPTSQREQPINKVGHPDGKQSLAASRGRENTNRRTSTDKNFYGRTASTNKAAAETGRRAVLQAHATNSQSRSMTDPSGEP